MYLEISQTVFPTHFRLSTHYHHRNDGQCCIIYKWWLHIVNTCRALFKSLVKTCVKPSPCRRSPSSLACRTPLSDNSVSCWPGQWEKGRFLEKHEKAPTDPGFEGVLNISYMLKLKKTHTQLSSFVLPNLAIFRWPKLSKGISTHRELYDPT